MFDYFELLINTLFSPQVLLLGLVFYVLIYKPDIVERIKTMKIFGAEFDLHRKIEEKIDQAVEKIDHSIEQKFDYLKEDYLAFSKTEFDVIASTKDIHKLGTELKAIAASLDDIDFVLKYLKSGADPDQVYAAACAIQVRPQPKFLRPLLSYIGQITRDEGLEGIRLVIGFKLLQCVEKIVTTDGRRTTQVVSSEDVEFAISTLKKFAAHPICDADRPLNGKDGIPSKTEKICNKFAHQVNIRQRT